MIESNVSSRVETFVAVMPERSRSSTSRTPRVRFVAEVAVTFNLRHEREGKDTRFVMLSALESKHADVVATRSLRRSSSYPRRCAAR